MFELPEAKRVRREDLVESDAEDGGNVDGADNAELIARLNAQIAQSLGLDFSENITAKPKITQPASTEAETPYVATQEGDVEDAQFEFRLFSTSAPTTKVVLESDKPTEGGLLRPRPVSYYIVANLPGQEKEKIAYAAVSGEDVLANSRSRAWGLELPWRVVKGTSLCKESQTAPVTQKSAVAMTRKGRPGKKSRISLRKKARVVQAKVKDEAEKMAQKEEALQDKKKRLNRAKKLRKRAKEKAQKGGGNDEGGSDFDG